MQTLQKDSHPASIKILFPKWILSPLSVQRLSITTSQLTVSPLYKQSSLQEKTQIISPIICISVQSVPLITSWMAKRGGGATNDPRCVRGMQIQPAEEKHRNSILKYTGHSAKMSNCNGLVSEIFLPPKRGKVAYI